MALKRPTLAEIIDDIAADFRAAISGATTLALRSVLRVFARAFGGAVHLMYGYADNIVRELFATSGSASFLDTQGSEFGILRAAATAATGNAGATGTNGTVIPAGTELKNANNVRYTTDAEATIAIGVATLALTAKSTGIEGNDSAGVTLTFVSPIVGIDTTATVDADGLTDGADEETDTAYRARILTRKQEPPAGGAEHDYITWAKEVTGVTRAWAVPGFQGAGTVAVYFVRDDDAGGILPSEAELAEVRAHIVEHEDASGRTVGIPVTAKPGLFVLAPELKTVNFEIGLDPNTVAVQTEVEAELTDLLLREGGPAMTISRSNISEAISTASGEIKHRLDVPAADVGAASNEVHVMGTITFNIY